MELYEISFLTPKRVGNKLIKDYIRKYNEFIVKDNGLLKNIVVKTTGLYPIFENNTKVNSIKKKGRLYTFHIFCKADSSILNNIKLEMNKESNILKYMVIKKEII